MRIHISQLEALRWIARLGSFRAAAAKLNIAQPTISMRVRELERLLKASLFDRTGYRAQLTPKGREMVDYAERILALAEAMENDSSGGGGTWGPIRLGAADTFALTCLPALMFRMEQTNPTLQLDLNVDFSAHLNQKLQKGEVDIAFVTDPVPGPKVAVEPLADLHLAWVASPKIPLPARTLRPEDLKSLPILTNPRPSQLFTTVWRWFADHGHQPERLSTCNSLAILIRMASAGYGVGLLPVALLRDEVERGVLQVLRTKPAIPPHRMWVGYRSDAPQHLISSIRRTAQKLASESDLMLTVAQISKVRTPRRR